MRLILSQYLHTLKERDEFDALLPDLLLAMGYVPISRPQTGLRQYGVDLAVVGKSIDDNVDELLLFVIKQGDIGRRAWDTEVQSVRQSLNDVLDVYLNAYVEPAHQNYRKKIILATTGDLKQDTQLSWDGYVSQNSDKADFAFWGGDKVAMLIERHLLDEHIFSADDRSDLRKALAFSSEHDYDLAHLNRLFLRQLGLDYKGALEAELCTEKKAIKALRTISLATQIFSHWAEDEGNLKQALFASEKALLWSWHYIYQNFDGNKKITKEIGGVLVGYQKVAYRYFQKLQPYLFVRDGLTGACQESAELSVVVFEQIGIIASIGLEQVMFAQTDPEKMGRAFENAEAVADALVFLIKNNTISGSPALDDHVTDIILAFSLLAITNRHDAARDWLESLVMRVNYAFTAQRHFPISTDSMEDLVEFTCFEKEEDKSRLSSTSWVVPSLAGWSVLFGRNDLYDALAEASTERYPEVCLQLWHPTTGYFEGLYFGSARYEYGEAEAPIVLPESASSYMEQMRKLLASERHETIQSSPAVKSGMAALDLIASRHFRTPVAPYVWYQIGGLERSQDANE